MKTVDALLACIVTISVMSAGCGASHNWTPERRAVLAEVQGANRPTAPGNRIADFRVNGLTGGSVDLTKVYSPKSLAGPPFLLEVWATWCRACVAAMPRLHDVHARFGSRVTMLSISIDEDPHDVALFRADENHVMPWLHASVPRPEDQTTLFATLLGAPGARLTPLYLLVDANGVIVASSPDLAASNIAEHIEKLVAAP